jgi:hypothetical protein
MGRTLLCSLGGTVAGFLVGFAAVHIAAGEQPHSDAGPMAFFVGIFLAGSGAIAGAIIGGVADLREFFARKEQASREARDRRESESGDIVK